MTDVILQLQLTSPSALFPRAFKTVNYCFIYNGFLPLALWARYVRIEHITTLCILLGKYFIYLWGIFMRVISQKAIFADFCENRFLKDV